MWCKGWATSEMRIEMEEKCTDARRGREKER